MLKPELDNPVTPAAWDGNRQANEMWTCVMPRIPILRMRSVLVDNPGGRETRVGHFVLRCGHFKLVVRFVDDGLADRISGACVNNPSGQSK
jgi:hypothetical protein